MPVAAANIVDTIRTAMYNEPRIRDIIIWIDANKRSIKPAASMTMPIKMNRGTAIN